MVGNQHTGKRDAGPVCSLPGARFIAASRPPDKTCYGAGPMSRIDPPSALPGDRSRRWAHRVALALLALLVLLLVGKGVRIAALPTEQQVAWNVVIDDGYYYLQVARNLARGHGSTFDRVNRTNGYQPLWTLALVPVFWFTDDPGVGMTAALILATLLGALSMVLLFIALERLVGAGAGLLLCGVVVANPYFLSILQGGLETPALFACLAGLGAFWALRGERVLAGERRACIGLSLLLAAVTLSRLDVAFVLLPFALLVAAWGRGWLRRTLWIALPGLLLLVPFLLWSWAAHGSPVPISGQVKAWVAATHTPTWELWKVTEQWRGVTRTLHELSQLWSVDPEPRLELVTDRLVLPAALLGLLTLRLIWSARARANRLALILVVGGAAGVTLHGLYLVYIYRSCGHWNYHYFFLFALFYVLLLAVSGPLILTDLGLILDRLLRGRPRRGYAALGVALSLPLLALLTHLGVPAAEKRYQELRKPPALSFRKSRLDAARNIAKNFPRETVFGAWWAGTLGYFSDRSVVNLDGVVNSGEFFRQYLKTDHVDRYVLDGPITHLVDFFWYDALSPGAVPRSRTFFWENDKEHVIHRLRSRLRLVHLFRFRGGSGTYLIDVMKPDGWTGKK